MPTLVYSPGVRAYIQTARAGLVDVTEDIVSGRVHRTIGRQPSEWGLELANRNRKYDGLFAPNDRVTIFLKRLYWLQSISGYINSAPYYNAKPSTVRIGGSCTLKYLQHFHWDPHTTASQNLLNGQGPNSVPGDYSGIPGTIERVKTLLTEVAEWDDDRIHIGNIPPSWQDFVHDVVEEVRQAAEALPTSGSLTPGGTGAYNLGTTHPDRNSTDNPSIGVFRETQGQASYFGGPEDESTRGRNPALTSAERAGVGASGYEGWNDVYYLALRIPTQHWGSGSSTQMRGGDRAPGLTNSQYTEGRNWWRNRKVLVTNPANGRQFVGRVVDIGPNVRTGKAIDMSKVALHEVLGASTGAQMTWTFATDSAPVGPVTSTDSTQTVSTPGRLSLPSPIPANASPQSGDFAWGGHSNGKIPESEMVEVRQSNGANIYLHPIAAEAFTQMRRAADKEGISLLLTGGFRSYSRQVSLKREKGRLAATPGTSNHGWGMAVDVNLGGGFSSKVYKWLQANGARYGWVNPTWARDASGIEEPWHWEFWGIFGAHSRAASRDASGQTRYQVDIQPGQFDALGNGIPQHVPYLGGAGQPISPSSGGTPGAAGSSGLFATDNWAVQGLQEDPTATGPWLHSNDKPLLPDVADLIEAAGRSMCSAPNGDFLAWFPDYFDLHGYSAVYDLVMMEVGNFSVDWSDTRLKSHFFVSGAVGPGGAGPSLTGNITDPTTARHLSKGVASLEYPGLLKVLLGTEDAEAVKDTARLLKRFGVRPDRKQMDNLLGPDAEFYIAVSKFMANWAEQFNADIPLAGFMPEVYPGMIVRAEDLNFQAYVNSVTHQFGFTGNGFTTSLNVIAPSRLDGKGLLGAALDAARELAPVGGKGVGGD